MFMDNATFTLHPVPQELQAEQSLHKDTAQYVIRKASFLDFPNILEKDLPLARKEYQVTEEAQKASHRPLAGLTAEVALFFDEAGYKIFAPYFKYDDSKLRDMLLAYMNGVR